MREQVIAIGGERYVLVRERDFNAVLKQVGVMARLATALAEQHNVQWVTPEFRTAFAEGMRGLARQSASRTPTEGKPND